MYTARPKDFLGGVVSISTAPPPPAKPPWHDSIASPNSANPAMGGESKSACAHCTHFFIDFMRQQRCSFVAFYLFTLNEPDLLCGRCLSALYERRDARCTGEREIGFIQGEGGSRRNGRHVLSRNAIGKALESISVSKVVASVRAKRLDADRQLPRRIPLCVDRCGRRGSFRAHWTAVGQRCNDNKVV